MLQCGHDLFAASQRLLAGAEGSHQEQRHGLRFLGREAGEGAHAQAQALLEVALVAEGLEHGLRGAPGDFVVGAQQQLFLVCIELVEGGARDVRELGQVEDAHRLIAAQDDQLGHRALQPVALVALDFLASEAMGAGRQPPVALTAATSRAGLRLSALGRAVHRANRRGARRRPGCGCSCSS